MTRRYMVEWWCSSTILYISTRWRSVASFKAVPHYPRGNSPLYALDRRLDEPQSRSELHREEKNLFSYRESSPGRPARSLVAVPAEITYQTCRTVGTVPCENVPSMSLRSLHYRIAYWFMNHVQLYVFMKGFSRMTPSVGQSHTG
jgi:hypothetical protein